MRLISKSSFVHTRLQNFTAGILFPAGQGDWYKKKKYGNSECSPPEDFCLQQKNSPNAHFYEAFSGLNIKAGEVPSKLANDEKCTLETFVCASEKQNATLPGDQKHIIYFPGANTYYQACFRDISTAARETGATVHAFNFPGTGLSTGQVKEANDLINAGLAMIRSLLEQNIHPDNIVLQGDCFGAAIAMEVKEQIAKQTQMNVRIIMNNSFQSFKAAVENMITASTWLPKHLKSIVKALLIFTGWHITPGKKFIHSGPYQCHLKHDGDLTLPTSSLSDKVQRMRDSKKEKYKDTCPEEYKNARNRLERTHILKVSEKAKKRLGEKFGVDTFGRINAHFADLCEIECPDGTSAYEGFINEFLTSSNAYIQAHPQKCEPADIAQTIKYMGQASSSDITPQQAKQMEKLRGLVEEGEVLLESSTANTSVRHGP